MKQHEKKQKRQKVEKDLEIHQILEFKEIFFKKLMLTAVKVIK